MSANLHVGFKHLKDVFYRMGLSDKDIVSLSGAHTLVNSCCAIHICPLVWVLIKKSHV